MLRWSMELTCRRDVEKGSDAKWNRNAGSGRLIQCVSERTVSAYGRDEPMC